MFDNLNENIQQVNIFAVFDHDRPPTSLPPIRKMIMILTDSSDSDILSVKSYGEWL